MIFAKNRCALIFLLITLLWQPACEASNSKDGSWLLLQHNRDFGDVRVALDDHGMKWENKAVGLTLIAREPKWQMIGYNFSSRQYYEFTNDELMRMMLGADSSYHRGSPPPGLKGSSIGILRGTDTTIAGHACVQYIYPRRIVKVPGQNRAKVVRDPSLDKSVYGPVNGPRREIWYATDILFPPVVSKALSGGLTTALNVPLREIHYGQDRQNQKFDLDTLVAKHTKFKASEFDAPKGFSKAASQMALLMNESTADDLLGPMKMRSGSEAK